MKTKEKEIKVRGYKKEDLERIREIKRVLEIIMFVVLVSVCLGIGGYLVGYIGYYIVNGRLDFGTIVVDVVNVLSGGEVR